MINEEIYFDEVSWFEKDVKFEVCFILDCKFEYYKDMDYFLEGWEIL